MAYMYQCHMRLKTYNHHCCSKHHEYTKVKHVNLYKTYEGAFYSVTATKRPVAALCNPLYSTALVSQLLTVSKNIFLKRCLPESPVEPTASLPTPFPTQPQQNTCNLNTLKVRLEWSDMEFAPPYRYMLLLASKLQQNTHNSKHKNNGTPPNKWVGHIGKVLT